MSSGRGGEACASGSGGSGAAAEAAPPAPAPPTADELAELHALVAKALRAGRNGRFAQGAEAGAAAAACAERLFGSTSVAAAEMHCAAAKCLHNRAAVDQAPDPVRLAVAAADTLLRAVAALEPRMADGSLLPRHCRAEEARFWRTAFLETQQPSLLIPGDLPDPAAHATTAQCAGYICAISVADAAMAGILACPWPQRLHPEQARTERFVLAALDLMVATAAGSDVSRLKLTCEAHLAARIEGVLGDERQRARLEPGFARAVADKWAGPQMEALREERVLLTFPELAAQMTLRDEALRKQLDVATHGLRRCGLRSCGRRETSVREFKLCSRCRAVSYCCAEHAAEHWAAQPNGHKRQCKFRHR